MIVGTMSSIESENVFFGLASCAQCSLRFFQGTLLTLDLELMVKY